LRVGPSSEPKRVSSHGNSAAAATSASEPYHGKKRNQFSPQTRPEGISANNTARMMVPL